MKLSLLMALLVTVAVDTACGRDAWPVTMERLRRPLHG